MEDKQYVVTMWCEWDIGCQEDVFATMEAAHKAADECLVEHIYNDELTCLQDAIDEGLVGFEVKEVRV